MGSSLAMPYHDMSSLTKDESWSKEDFYRIRKKAYKFFLKEGHLWKFPKRRIGTPLRVVVVPWPD